MELLQTLAEKIINGQTKDAEKLIQQALDNGIEPADILNLGLIAGMEVVSEKFRNNDFFVPEVLIAARAMKAGMNILRPKLVESGVQPIGKLVIGTIQGDLHDIGKNLVAMMMEGAGIEVIDLGVDVTPEKYIAQLKEHDAQVLGMSALLTTTMVNMKATIDALSSHNLRDRVKVIVGGAPLTQHYADDIGADGYAPDAASAVDLVKQILQK